MAPALVANPRGSAWHRWDPHIHAPGTVFNDQFKGDWNAYLQAIEAATPTIRALGVTDYCGIQGYREVRARKADGRLKDVQLLFPNVEFRLGIETAKNKPINIHLIFSPDDPEHETHIERILARLSFDFDGSSYHCTSEDLIRLGKAFEPTTKDSGVALRLGVTQFKTSLRDLHNLFKTERWMRENCLVAVASKSGDGTSGLQDDGSWAATRREIESFADIIFGSSPAQRAFWLGQTEGHGPEWIEEHYRHLKPCLHGSDAHRVEQINSVEHDRYCWIKGDLTFETLRQTVIEPEDRVSLGPEPVAPVGVADLITDVSISHAPWVSKSTIGLNPGLVAIIGARGSGKTALADIVATGASSPIASDADGSASFLWRASEHLGIAKVSLLWGDSSVTDAPLNPTADRDEAQEGVKYLSQHFVERLCSAEGLAVALRGEMERVVFDNVEQTARLGAGSFDELIDIHVQSIQSRRDAGLGSMHRIAEQLVQEDDLKERLPEKRREAEALRKQIDSDKKMLTSLLPKDKAVHIAKLAKLETVCTSASSRVEALRRRRKTVADLEAAARTTETVTEPARYVTMKQQFSAGGLSETAWAAFKMRFVGDVYAETAKSAKDIDAAITRATKGPAGWTPPGGAEPSADWPLDHLIARRDAAKKEVGIDGERQKQYDARQKLLSQRELTLQRLDAEIKHAEGGDERRKTLIAARRDAYREVIQSILDEEGVLKDLYAPIRKQLEGARGALGKLEFGVTRDVDIEAWCRKGEELIDLRIGSELKGKGSLRHKAEEYLLPAWKNGSADDIVEAFERFRADTFDALKQSGLQSIPADRRRTWFYEVADWLRDTSHITVRYGIEYEGVSIEHLSPGTRGVVLLLLYLAIDRNDTRPLIIDQPEENLDPNSVYAELVPHFRQARKRRQIVVVTHNANLVVNTDADQVVVAKAERKPDMALPLIHYQTGAIENKGIRAEICELLEGGQRAFLDRERRYRLKWGESLALETLGAEPSSEDDTA